MLSLRERQSGRRRAGLSLRESQTGPGERPRPSGALLGTLVPRARQATWVGHMAAMFFRLRRLPLPRRRPLDAPSSRYS